MILPQYNKTLCYTLILHITVTEGLLRVNVFTCAVVVQDLCEDCWVTIEEVLSKYPVIVGLRLCETGQSSGRNLSQRGAVNLVPYSANVDAHPVTCHPDANHCLLFYSRLLFPVCLNRRLSVVVVAWSYCMASAHVLGYFNTSLSVSDLLGRTHLHSQAITTNECWVSRAS